jgi:hypothetical protein
MGDLLSFSDHIDKQQTKNQYLGYEKLQVLEGTIESFINDIPDIKDNECISYFVKIVKKQIPVFEDKYFHCKYLWNADFLKYKLDDIRTGIHMYMLASQKEEELITSLSFLMQLTLFFNKKVRRFAKIDPNKYEKLGLEFIERSIELKKSIESWKPTTNCEGS